MIPEYKQHKIESRPYRIKKKTTKRKRRNYTRVKQKYMVLQRFSLRISIYYGSIHELVQEDHYLQVL